MVCFTSVGLRIDKNAFFLRFFGKKSKNPKKMQIFHFFGIFAPFSINKNFENLEKIRCFFHLCRVTQRQNKPFFWVAKNEQIL